MAVTEVLTKLAESDLEGLVDSARETISDVHQLVGSPDLKLAIRSVDQMAGRLGEAAGSVSQLATGLDSNVSGLTPGPPADEREGEGDDGSGRQGSAAHRRRHQRLPADVPAHPDLARGFGRCAFRPPLDRVSGAEPERGHLRQTGGPGEVMRSPVCSAGVPGAGLRLLHGCVHVGQQQDQPWRLFTLSPLPEPEAEQAASTSSPGPVQPRGIGVGPIHLPGYLDQDQIVTRISQNHVTLSDNDRWAEPLEDNIGHVLAQNLSMLLQNDRVILHPWPGQQRPTYQLEIEVLSFETDTAGTAHLAARWFLRDVASRQTIAREGSTRPPRQRVPRPSNRLHC